MAEIEYRSNSHKSKELENDIQKKKVEKVVNGVVRSKKKSLVEKTVDLFAPDDVEDVKSYVREGIVVPAIKDIILDVVKAFLDINGNSHSNRSTTSRVSYRKYYEDRDRDQDRVAHRTRTGYDYEDVILDKRTEAEDVLSSLDDLIDTYGMASVADLYDLVGINCNYTDNKYGWTNLRSASIAHVRDGYMIKLPRALPLN